MSIASNTPRELDRRAPGRSSRRRLPFLQLGLLFLACPFLLSSEAPPDGAQLNAVEDEDAVDFGQFKLDSPLKGFDLSVLRPERNLDSYLYPIKKLDFMPRTAMPSNVEIELALEFGNPSGLAEAWRKDVMIRAIINDLIGELWGEELLKISGKFRLKEKMKKRLNERLFTAKVRRVYFTHFVIKEMPKRLRGQPAAENRKSLELPANLSPLTETAQRQGGNSTPEDSLGSESSSASEIDRHD